jgi:hypothetical protein
MFIYTVLYLYLLVPYLYSVPIYIGKCPVCSTFTTHQLQGQ